MSAAEAPVFTLEEARKRASFLDSAVSTGLSGMTTASIKEILYEDDDVSRNFLDVVNSIVAGNVPSAVMSLLRSGRACAVAKPDGEPRPLGIGENAVRFAGSMLLRKVSADLRVAVAPANLGLGTDNGCELVFRILERKLLRDGGVLGCTDEATAFNKMDRSVCFAALEKVVPGAVPYIDLLYSKPGDLICPKADGSLKVVSNGVGARMGCPWGSAMYTVGQSRQFVTLSLY